ncbi:AAA family ATPase [Sorangium sp. So ce1151]|uniref:AAA family ATPase n=1 Tax=Sorangium sp. So ce1151 TaxID=3133332 RepID=UPI003F6048CB
MHLHVVMVEDARGSQRTRAKLFLHGQIAWPDDPASWWKENDPGSLVEHDIQSPAAEGRVPAYLDVLAPDDLDEEAFAAELRELRMELSRSPQVVWARRGVTAASFWRAPRVVPQQESILDALLEAANVRYRRRRLRTSLHVSRLVLTDFRGIDQLTLGLSSRQTTVLVGTNGSGKTTLLDAAVLLLSPLQSGILEEKLPPRRFTDADIMNGRLSSSIEITADLGGDPVTWSLVHERGGEAPEPNEERLLALDKQVARIRAEIARGDVCLPVAVYYPVNRAVLDIPLRIRTRHPFDPLEAYDGALAGGRSNFRLFFEWFRNREDLENERRIQYSRHRDHQLEAVRRAIQSIVPEFSGLRVQRAPVGLVVTKGEWTLYVDQLSQGEKCLLAMVGDLARRLAMANPFADDPLQGGGVVLIDELELHLHPGWQRRIVPALERTFPNCQFLVTTHSPAVLGHVEHDAVVILKAEGTGVRVARPDTSKGMDVNRILEDLLDVPARPEEFQAKLDELHRRIDEGDTVGARALHAELSATLSSTDPALVKAEVLLRRREAARR